jgi:rhamnogalacturonyl hydrolase YesR
MREGFFPAVIETEMEQVEIDGEKYKRSKGWETARWGNSNRNPYTREISKSPYHILDMSWTALLMLRWYEELEQDSDLLDYASEYAESLIPLQDKKGFFPGWLDYEDLSIKEHLNDSPESAMSVTFLLKLYEITKDSKYKDSALKAMDALLEEVIPDGRWEDFETYWSCCAWGHDTHVGNKVERNDMYKQCNFFNFLDRGSFVGSL